MTKPYVIETACGHKRHTISTSIIHIVSCLLRQIYRVCAGRRVVRNRHLSPKECPAISYVYYYCTYSSMICLVYNIPGQQCVLYQYIVRLENVTRRKGKGTYCCLPTVTLHDLYMYRYIFDRCGRDLFRGAISWRSSPAPPSPFRRKLCSRS